VTEEVSGVSRVVVWPAPQAAAATDRPAPPPGRKHLPSLPPLDPQQEQHHQSFYRLPRGGDETETEAGGGRGRSRSRSRAIMERAKSFERAASSGGQREVSRERRPLTKKRSPSGKQPKCIEILSLARKL